MEVKVKGMDERVVIAGAGYAGLTAASVLDGKVDLTLIDRKVYHEMLTRAHLVAGGLEEVHEDIILLNEVLRGRKSRIVQASIRSINLNERKIVIENDGRVEDIHYDHLILALGSEVNYYGVDGAREYAIGFRSMKDALKIRRRLNSMGDGDSIVVVGGGATGISLAGALSEARMILGKRFRIKVIEALDRILYGWDEYIVDKAKEVLESRGVDILTNTKVVKVRDHSIVIDDGEEMRSDLTVWAAGVKGSSIDVMPEVSRVKGYRIEVDKFSRIRGYDDAYAVGDISALRLDDGSYAPQLAQLAVRQGYRVAMNILNSIDGKEIRPLLLKMQGAILSLGSECIGTIGGLRLEGELCRYVEEFITYNYKRMLHGDGLALLAYEDDPLANVVTFSRALSYLSVRYTLQLARLYATTLGLGCYIGAESAGVKRMNWLVR
ncbi:MAG: FAD-dependent oxidoreductase [Candidatus Nitrosocaldus sp.]